MEFSVFTKSKGILTKELRLENGVIVKDSSQCRMANGSVQIASVTDLIGVKEILKNLDNDQAISLGVAAECFDGNIVSIVKKGNEKTGAVSRTKTFFQFPAGEALMLLDHDAPCNGQALTLDNLRAALLEIMPELNDCEMLILGSTSSGVYQSDEVPPKGAAGGAHVYIKVDVGAKIPEMGAILGGRCWLKDWGRVDISKSGSKLLRTLFDECVYSPERLIFEAIPLLGDGLQKLPRDFRYWQGGTLKTETVAGLTDVQKDYVKQLQNEALDKAEPEAAPVRTAHQKIEVRRQTDLGVSQSIVRDCVERSMSGELSGIHPLQFAGQPLLTVLDVCRNPTLYHDLELVDPEESTVQGAAYRAKLYKTDNGVVIKSFRGGGCWYHLKKVDVRYDNENPYNIFEQIEALLSMGMRPDIFEWAGALSFIGDDGVIRNLTYTMAQVSIGRMVRFYTLQKTKEGWVRVTTELPVKLWRAFLEKGSWKIPKLKGLTHAPYFYGGETVQRLGYYSDSGLYLTSGFNFSLKVLKSASHQDASRALKRLLGLLAGFPFETDVDETVAIAMMMTAVMRLLLNTAPMFAISARTKGTGKTKLAEGIVSVISGEVPPTQSFVDDEKEMAKKLFSSLLRGSPAIIVDNVKLGVAFGGDALCSVLTSTTYEDRELGLSVIRKVSTRALMVVTGNNLKLASDITRRSLMIRLDAKCERPELRHFDKDFITLCCEKRYEILRDILIILSAYHAAGCPDVPYTRLGSFEQWSEVVCKPLIWLGLEDPVEGQAKADADEGVARLSELLLLWRSKIGKNPKTAKQALDVYAISEWFNEEFEGRGGANSRKVGNWLAKYAGQVIDGMRIIEAGEEHRAKKWKLETVSEV